MSTDKNITQDLKDYEKMLYNFYAYLCNNLSDSMRIGDLLSSIEKTREKSQHVRGLLNAGLIE